MSNTNSATIVQRLWNYCNVLRDDGVSYDDYVEQDRIDVEIERRLSVEAELEATVEANLKRSERLRQAILKQAFDGKLVPQDPEDEPAGVLLERIRDVK